MQQLYLHHRPQSPAHENDFQAERITQEIAVNIDTTMLLMGGYKNAGNSTLDDDREDAVNKRWFELHIGGVKSG